MSMTPKSWRIWYMGLPLRPCSDWTSSYWRSSIMPFSLIRANRGLDKGSDIMQSAFGLGIGVGGGAHGLRQLHFLQFLLDGDRVLGFGEDLLPGNHARHVFLQKEAIQGNHAPLGAGLNVRVETEGLVVADQRPDGR